MQVTWLAGAPLDFAALRSELAVPGEFSPEVVAAAQAAATDVRLPDDDATNIPFVTVDPAGSEDLDQALHIAAAGDGYLVSYAIADVAAFVSPGAVIDLEANARGETIYFPDARVPLHPVQLSEGAASLLPGQLRPAVLWQITLDALGLPTNIAVRHARVRSEAQLDYAGLQQMITDGSGPEAVRLLPAVGALRLAQAAARHAINLDVPEQEVMRSADGQWTLRLREQLDVERWNAELSLLTGMCAAQLMIEHGIGILRTLPPPPDKVVGWLRSIAPALDVVWPKGAAPGDVLTGLDRGDPKHVAFIDHAMSLLRGAGYTMLGASAASQPTVLTHAGVGAPYAHVTAPLRRLVDRYASTLCVALANDQPVPAWIADALAGLPATMARADQRANQADRAVVDMTEAWLVKDRVGARFDAVVLDTDDDRAKIGVDEPPIRASAHGAGFVVGERVALRLTEADVATRVVRFERAES